MLTIGLPFHNNRDTLADAIRAVFAQSLRDWLLILLDDGSTDGSLSIARSVRDDRVRVISDGHNLGLAARLNQIADLAEGPYTARMDADDLMHPQRLARQVALLQRDPSLDLVDTGLLSIDQRNRPSGRRCCTNLQITPQGLISGRVPVHASVVARTEWYRSHRYDARFRRAQDFELWNRAFARGSLRVRRIPEPLYFAREGTATTYARARSTHVARRQILKIHGPQIAGPHTTRLELAKSCFKQAAYYWASKCGLERHLVNTRNERLDTTETLRMQATINAILSTPVPGLAEDR